MSRRTFGVAAIVAISLSACTSSTPTTGILTGTADACTGLAGSTTSSVSVVVFQGKQTVARQVVHNGGTYRIVLAPGTYGITNEGTPQQGLGLGAKIVAGKTNHLDLPNTCF